MEALERVLPPGRTEALVTQELPDELLVYDLNRHRAHCLNKTAAAVWKHCDGCTSISEAIRLLGGELGVQVDADAILLALDQLDRARLLNERIARTPEMKQARMTRREAIRKVGLAGAVALPLVISIIAPTAAEAGTCLAKGTSCVSSAQCCSGICTGTPKKCL
jgi:hypothetical protein